MATTWADFLKDHKDHKDQDEYNKREMEIAQLWKSKEDKIQVFKKMTEVQPLVMVSKSAVDDVEQYLFNFSSWEIQFWNVEWNMFQL